MTDKTHASVADALAKHVFLELAGFPVVLRSDNADELALNEVILEITHTHTGAARAHAAHGARTRLCHGRAASRAGM